MSANILTTSQPAGSTTQVSRLDGGQIDVQYVDPSLLPSGSVQPFRGTFYVDPLFTGVQTGSESNPFTTIAAAFAAGAALALAGGVVELPPSSTVTENVVFPTTGEWELRCRSRYVPATVAILNGTIDLSTSATARRALSNIQVTGNVTGNAVGGSSRLLLTNCILDANLTLTVTGGALWRVGLAGAVNDNGAVGFAGSITGSTSVVGFLYGFNYLLSGTVTLSQPSIFSGCSFNPGGIVSNAAAGAFNTVTLQDCLFSGGYSFSAAGGSTLTVLPDGVSSANLLAQNATTGGAGTVLFKTLRGNGSTRQTLAGNSGVINLGKYPSAQMTINVSLTVLAIGTTAALQATVTYTDMTGAVVTQNIGGTLNAGGAAAIGDKLSASLSFSQNGSTNISFQVTGVTAAGALSYQADAAMAIAS